jgi:hypothetical protein
MLRSKDARFRTAHKPHTLSLTLPILVHQAPIHALAPLSTLPNILSFRIVSDLIACPPTRSQARVLLVLAPAVLVR